MYRESEDHKSMLRLAEAFRLDEDLTTARFSQEADFETALESQRTSAIANYYLNLNKGLVEDDSYGSGPLMSPLLSPPS